MQKYDKDKIKENLDIDTVFDIVRDFGGEPKMTDFGFVSATICHNHAGEGSHKLYYYENTKLFRCYTGCDSTFDIFELIKKVKVLSQPTSPWALYDSVRWAAARCGLAPTLEDDDLSALPDWSLFEKYNKLAVSKESALKITQLKEYDSNILKHMPQPLIYSWMQEGIDKEVLAYNQIGYYPPSEQITIPHFDIDGRFVGLRGRALGSAEAELYGKYRPLMAGSQMYNHALGLNLYNINNSSKNIPVMKKAIIFEGEKSCLLYQSYFGHEADISVACCGSSVSGFQMSLLLTLGAEEIIIAFDRQFQAKGDDEFKHLTKNLKNIHDKYGQYATISFIFDKKDQLPYKASPIDCGKELFIDMYKNRITL